MYEVLTLILVAIIVVLIVGFHQKSTNKICLSRKRLEGKTVLVTGGTAGMGLEIAKDLAHRGARVIVACPFIEEGNDAVKQIKEESKNDNIVFKLLDLASLESIRTFANDILETEERMGILINNAGVGFPHDVVTSDGMSSIMQINYYGTIYLTLLLLPLLMKTGKIDEPSRIVLTSSVLHLVGQIDVRNFNRVDYWTRLRTYGNSKLCLVMFANELVKRMKHERVLNVVINCVDPGAVGTRIFASLDKTLGFIIKHLFSILFKTPWEGAQTALYVALNENAGKVNGGFFKNCQLSKAKSVAYCDEPAKMLWEDTMKCVNLSDDDLKRCFKDTRRSQTDITVKINSLY